MWLCGLNAKCLLSKPFPADSWAQLESRAGPSCYYICSMYCQPQPCTPSSTVSHYRWTGPWLNVFYGILTFHTDLHISYFILLLAETFFWVSAAGHLLVSVGWGCRSPPVLEILRLQPRLHLLRQFLHAIVVTLEDWEGQPLFLMFSISPALIFYYFPPLLLCAQQDTDTVLELWCCIPLVFHDGDLVVSKGVAKEEKSMGHVVGTRCLPKMCHKATIPWLVFQMADLLPWYPPLK